MGTVTFENVDAFEATEISTALNSQYCKVLMRKVEILANTELTEENKQWQLERADEEANWLKAIQDKMKYTK